MWKHLLCCVVYFVREGFTVNRLYHKWYNVWAVHVWDDIFVVRHYFLKRTHSSAKQSYDSFLPFWPCAFGYQSRKYRVFCTQEKTSMPLRFWLDNKSKVCAQKKTKYYNFKNHEIILKNKEYFHMIFWNRQNIKTVFWN